MSNTSANSQRIQMVPYDCYQTPKQTKNTNVTTGLRYKKYATRSIFQIAEKYKDHCTSKSYCDTLWSRPRVNTKEAISVYDNIIEPRILDNIEFFCKNSAWKYKQHSLQAQRAKELTNTYGETYKNRWSSISFIFFSLDVTHEDYFYNIFYDKILPNLDCISNALKPHVVIERMYFNTHLSGMCGAWHTDGKTILDKNDDNRNGPTVLLYVSKDWSLHYHGSTSFYLNDHKRDSIFHVESKCGRVVVFPSYITHRMNDISRFPQHNNRLRYVIAFHLQYDNCIYS